MAELSLLDAFRLCAPPVTGSSALDEARHAASVRVYDFLGQLAASMAGDRDVMEDVVASFFVKFCENGPRGARPDDPQDDERVRRWFLTCLRNERTSYYRKRTRAREVQPDDAGPGAIEGVRDKGPTPDEEILVGERLVQIQAAIVTISDRIVPDWAARMRGDSGETFKRDIEVRFRIARGLLSADAATVEAYGILTTTNRNTFDQRQSRALRRLHTAIEEHIVAETLPPSAAEALRNVHEALQRMELHLNTGEGVRP